ncbi:MAG: response regulator [Opitutales bacterium]
MTGRILVLDDEENYAEMLRDLLLDHNYRVDMATRPERAITQLEEIPYDLVISDYKMPVMDGADFLKRARELYPNLPFILVSGLMNTPELVKVANMSVTLVMEKPLDTSAFLDHVARFSTPMTEQEKAELARSARGGTAAGSESVVSYPDEPRYFSASCTSSKWFMLDFWRICKSGSVAFIQEPEGGEAELAVKDVSVWLGNSDSPVPNQSWEALKADSRGTLKALKEAGDNSNVAIVRLKDDAQLDSAIGSLQAMTAASVDANVLLVFISGSRHPAAEFAERTHGLGVSLPPFSGRSTDVAQYARRFARIVANQKEKEHLVGFTPEAAYAILAHDWPGNYRQLSATITRAAENSEDEALSLESLQLEGAEEAPAAERLERLLRKVQSAYLSRALEESNGNPSALAREIGSDAAIYSERDLLNLPLIKPELARL